MTPLPASGLTPLWSADAIAGAVDGALQGEAFAVNGICIDSRDVAPGDLFIAMTGARDGHDFVAGALASGAAGALTTRDVGRPSIIVSDTQAALVALAEASRTRATKARRGAVTGSVGKTSVTQAVRAGLELAGPGAHASVKSYNNHIGVPLTLARMPRDTRRAVFEIGMNHADEIAPLSLLVRPHVVAVTTVEAAHVENFADGEAGVARAKAEIFAGVERGGLAVLNADNRWFDYLKGEARRAGIKLRTFGADSRCDARLLGFSPAPGGASVAARIDGRNVEYPLRHSAAHWGPMSLCVLLTLLALDVDLETGMAALADFAPLAGRGAERCVRGPAGAFTLIDESFNASPVAVRAAVTALGLRRARGRRLVALTDMLELGDAAPGLHAGLFEAIAAAKIDRVFCAGPLMRNLWDVLPEHQRGAWARDAESLAQDLNGAVAEGDVVMVKGSKSSLASKLVESLVALAGKDA